MSQGCSSRSCTPGVSFTESRDTGPSSALLAQGSRQCRHGSTSLPSPFKPSFFFQAVLSSNKVSTGAVGFDLVTTGNDDMSFDVSKGTFIAPALGFYQFYFNVTCSTASQQSAGLQLEVDGKALYSSIAGCPGNQTQTISGNALIQLLPNQKVTVSTKTGSSLQLIGPTTPGAPPYPTVFSGFSLF